MLLVGRREQRSLNSWMHNLPTLTGGKGRCTARLHSSEIRRLGLEDGTAAILSSRVGSITITVEASDDLMPGVVSVPHGWGHDAPGAQLHVAGGQAGVNANLLSDEQVVDAPSGTTVLNGIPVTLTPT
jgi:anaerobic selenocysteine-containing dehydrogenase